MKINKIVRMFKFKYFPIKQFTKILEIAMNFINIGRD